MLCAHFNTRIIFIMKKASGHLHRIMNLRVIYLNMHALQGEKKTLRICFDSPQYFTINHTQVMFKTFFYVRDLKKTLTVMLFQLAACDVLFNQLLI